MSADFDQALTDYLSYWASITPETVDRLSDLASVKIRFRDPFTEVSGIEAVNAAFRKMFDQLEGVRFVFDEQAVSGPLAFVNWRMTAVPKRGPKRTLVIEAASRLRFDDEGRVLEHIDYWDATPVLEGIPVLGQIVRLVRRRLS